MESSEKFFKNFGKTEPHRRNGFGGWILEFFLKISYYRPPKRIFLKKKSPLRFPPGVFFEVVSIKGGPLLGAPRVDKKAIKLSKSTNKVKKGGKNFSGDLLGKRVGNFFKTR